MFFFATNHRIYVNILDMLENFQEFEKRYSLSINWKMTKKYEIRLNINLNKLWLSTARLIN